MSGTVGVQIVQHPLILANVGPRVKIGVKKKQFLLEEDCVELKQTQLSSTAFS